MISVYLFLRFKKKCQDYFIVHFNQKKKKSEATGSKNWPTHFARQRKKGWCQQPNLLLVVFFLKR